MDNAKVRVQVGAAVRHLKDVLGEGGRPSGHYALPMEVVYNIRDAIMLLEKLMQEAALDIRAHGRRGRNPPLILLSNPPMRYGGSRGGHGPLKFLDLISDECHAILYRHIEDGKPYRHDFERPTQLVAVERNGKKDVLITSEDGAPIWQDF